MPKKRSNGEGSVTYDSRRKRYRAKVTVGWELNEETGKSKQITKTIGSNYKTKGEAAAALAEYFKDPYDVDKKNITFAEVYDMWFEDYFAEDHESMKFRIKAAYKYCSSLYNKKFREISILDMKRCIAFGEAPETRGKNKGQMRKASPQTKETMKMMFNRIYDFALEARIAERNYAREFAIDKKVAQEKEQNRKIKIPFTDDEVKKLWKSVEFVPFADMVLYACYSGWRPSELVGIKLENVDLENGIIYGGIKTEAGKNRAVPIHSDIRHIIEARYTEAKEIDSNKLFNDPGKKKGVGLSYDQYLTRFNHVLETLKFSSEITPHATRHTFITKAKSPGVKMDENILKLIVGHNIKDVTEHVYTHRSIEELKAEMELIKWDKE